ncbi:MAG: HNH endonuclease [Fibrobacter sp.]|nr:HNH endonuclease [Fibrobacter sp.]
MVNRINQIYEEYWSYTAAFTDMNGSKFLALLKSCLDFFDNQKDLVYSEMNYERLQNIVCKATNITQPSARKAINQLVKLGFLKPYLKGYVAEAKEYMQAKTNFKRQCLLSKIVYHYSNFNNAMTQKNTLGQGQINFFIKTLTEVGRIDDDALTALMSVDIKKYPKGFLDQEELDKVFYDAQKTGFIGRKYNQISHLKNLLSRLDDLQVVDNSIYFKTDAESLFSNEEMKKNVRDSYLQRIYKSELEEESRERYHSEMPKCMLEGLNYPVMIASHIKPYSHCLNDVSSQFNVNNGLLLSKNMDSLFDLGYMSFDEKGRIIPSKKLSEDVVSYLSQFRLNQMFITPERMKYMKYHRANVFEKRYRSQNARKYVFQEKNTPVLYSKAAEKQEVYKVK